jgi:hypothetical protein
MTHPYLGNVGVGTRSENTVLSPKPLLDLLQLADEVTDGQLAR